ncbi:hypothetical protein ACH5RR_025413 [Cinchona calisaya]|uniref:Uncharacterized protein n=1 Tax=Cinchona calisaya TaxID=153742 RepID=A0ABD2Z1I6_9GENT
MTSASKHKEHELYVKKNFDSKYPYFMASMHSHGLLCSHTVYIPAAFSRTYLHGCPVFVVFLRGLAYADLFSVILSEVPPFREVVVASAVMTRLVLFSSSKFSGLFTPTTEESPVV